MNKINFENAPSTNTPLSAENLNLMQDNMEQVGAVVSATEPTTNEKVWFKKSNNLFNAYDDYDYTTGTNKISYSIDGSNKITATSAGDWSRIGCTIPNLKPNTQYTVSTNITNAAGMSCGIYLAAGQYDIQTSTNFRAKYTGTTDANGKLYFLLYSNFTADTATADVIFDNIQVEQGAAATKFEEFVEKEIYTKNANGAYEKFDNNTIHMITGREVATNEYIDGKRIYKKVISVEALPNATTLRVDHNIASIDKIIDYSAIGRSSSGAIFGLNWLAYNENAGYLYCNFQATKTQIIITSNYDVSGYTGKVTLYYTKN